MATATPAPILEIDAAPRQTVRINKRTYELRSPGEFAYLVYRQHAQKFARLGALLIKKRPTAKENTEQERLLDDLCRVIVIAPDAVHDTLRVDERLAIVQVFTVLLETPAFRERLTMMARMRGRRSATKAGSNSRRA